MKTKVLFSALCLLISISVCAESQKTTVSKITQNGQEKTVYVMTSDGGKATVTTTTSSSKGGKKSSTTITKQSNGSAASVLASDGESLIDIDLSDLPKLKAEEMPEYPGGMSAMMVRKDISTRSSLKSTKEARGNDSL